MNTLMGIDLGTTGLKVTLFGEDGTFLGSEYCEYPIAVPQPGYAEQDPNHWWEGFVSACRRLNEKQPQAFAHLAGIGICGQMHTQVYLDRHDRILRPAITWMDQRSSGIVQRINADDAARALLFAECQNEASTTYTAPQARWVQENQPEVWREVQTILVAKDYLKYRLTGQKITDYAEASGTLLFDVAREAWSEEAFRYFAIPRAAFPEVGPSDTIMGRVTREAAALTGIAQGTPVANGSSDNSASALGAGMVHPGQVTLIIGTAGVITVCSDRPLPDPGGRTLCWHYCLPGRWVTLGITQTAGESLNWFKNAFDQQEEVSEATASAATASAATASAAAAAAASTGDIFDRYNQSVTRVPDGSGGLIFLPYLNGERTPYWDPYARGVFFGVNLATEKAHFIKAIMEGVSFALRNNIETVEALGITVNEVRAVGGGLKSPVWLQTLAKILRRPVATVSVRDTANLGNILLCGKALGIYSDYAATVERLVTTDQTIRCPEGEPVYEKQYPLFLELYDQLRDTFRKAGAGSS